MDLEFGIGERIKSLRIANGWTQSDFAEKVGRSRQTILNWEKGNVYPDSDVLSVVADVFGCSVDTLLTGRPEVLKRKEVKETITIPVLHPAVIVCAGEGFRLEDVLIEAEDYQEIPLDDSTGKLGDLSPFLVKVEGDSMTGVQQGSELYCNPNEEIRTGDCAVCCIDGKWMVRGVIWRHDGAAELRPTNGDYHPIVVGRDELRSGWAKIIAKVMWIKQVPPKFF